MAHYNTTSNQTFTCSQDSEVKTALKILAHVINIVVSLAANFTLCIVVKKNKKLRKTMDYLIINNAIADLVIPLIASPKVLTEIVSKSSDWKISGSLGDVTCKFVLFILDFCPMVSMLTLVFLTISRFIAVVFPFQASRAPRRLRLYYIAVSWGASILYGIPYLFIIKYHPMHGCYIVWDANTSKIYFTAMLTVFIGVPLCILVLMYTTMLYYIRKSARKIPVQYSGAKKRQRATRKLTFLSFSIVAGFIVCWGPYFSLAIIKLYFPDIIIYMLLSCLFNDLLFAALLLAYSNSSITPLLCLFFVESYRDGVRKLMGMKRSRASFKYAITTTKLSTRGMRTSVRKNTTNNEEKAFFCTSL